MKPKSKSESNAFTNYKELKYICHGTKEKREIKKQLTRARRREIKRSLNEDFM